MLRLSTQAAWIWATVSKVLTWLTIGVKGFVGSNSGRDLKIKWTPWTLASRVLKTSLPNLAGVKMMLLHGCYSGATHPLILVVEVCPQEVIVKDQEVSDLPWFIDRELCQGHVRR